MDELARRFVDACRRGEPLDLRSLSADALSRAAADIVDMPEAVEFFQALGRAGTGDGASAAADLVAHTADPGVMAETVRLLPTVPLSDRFARSLLRAFIAQSADRSRYSGTRSHALLGAMFVAQGRPALLRALQSHLLDVTADDEGDYLRHVARIQGVVLAHVSDADLYRQLELLLDVPEAEDEALVALGLLHIADALGDGNRETAISSLSKASQRMKQAMAAAEVRYDAALYSSCLDVLLDFQQGNHSQGLQDRLASIRTSAFEYMAILMPSNRRIDRTSWLGSSIMEGIFWSELGARLAALDLSLLKKAWLDAARVIEDELARVFCASKLILKRSADGGVEAVVRPRIVAAMREERSRLACLDQWLEDNPQEGSAAAIAGMRTQIQHAMEASLRRNPIEAVAAAATAAEILSEDHVPLALRGQAAKVLAASMSADFLLYTDPVTIRILEVLHSKLFGNPDYQGAAAGFFLLILYYTLLFVSSRENQTPAAVSGVDYLFNLSRKEPPVESDLHRDYFGFLQGTPLKECAQREVPGIAHGRADVHFQQAGVKTVAELKKTHTHLTLAQLVDEFGLQTVSYQRTSVRFCALMVLDLVDRGGGSDHIENLVDVIRKRPPSGQADYSVAVFRVQGRKQSPSSL
ncbi:hypothetical protein NKJ06_17745 [Mesorhizobium sp. M0293]|uniref:hypothetical protein n=1 Tax=Mesorhizobium sp. M0293 TaxID=2956930 RepID=UPI00333D4FEA